MISNNAIHKAVAQVFHDYAPIKGQKMNLPAVCTIATNLLDGEREHFRPTMDRVKKYILRSGRRGGRYVVQTGKYGGVSVR